MLIAACGGGGDRDLCATSMCVSDAPRTRGGSSGGMTLSDRYPGDVGLGADPAVIWFEDFEAGSVSAITGRYDQAQGTARMQLVTDAPSGNALALTAGGSVSAVDLYKQLPDQQ